MSDLQTWVEWVAEHGIVMVAEAEGLPSLVREVTGETGVRNWWSHPLGSRIHNISYALREHPDIASLKLVDGKVTLVHRALFPILVRLGTDHELRARRMRRLPEDARRLLEDVEAAGELRLDLLSPGFPGGAAAMRRARCKLEERALLLGRDVHTASGAHAPILESWSAFRLGRNVEPVELSLDSALGRLREHASGLKIAFEVS